MLATCLSAEIMVLLSNGLLAAGAMPSFFSSLRNARDRTREEDDSSFALFDCVYAADEPLPAEHSATLRALPAQSFEESSSPPPAAQNLLFPFIRDGNALLPLPRMEEGSRIAFRTKTESEVLDDGFRWRKYGKKSVKNRPNNPRNYYRCSADGCAVKKRVERDQEDSRYVMTTYEGVHNHGSPGDVCYVTHDIASSRFLFSGSCSPNPT